MRKMDKAIILVAGKGTRLKPLTDTTHKCLTKVNGIPILINTLNALDKIGIREVVLVVGYLGEEIHLIVGEQFGNIKIRYAWNMQYAETNTSASLQIGLEDVFDFHRLFLLEGDVFFEEEILKTLAEESCENATVIEKYREGLDGTFVELNSLGYVKDWRHKSTQDRTFDYKSKYKTVNIHRFGKEFVNDILMPITNEVVQEYNGKEPLESIMRRIVLRDEHILYGVETHGKKWVEIDNQKDLAIAERVF